MRHNIPAVYQTRLDLHCYIRSVNFCSDKKHRISPGKQKKKNLILTVLKFTLKSRKFSKVKTLKEEQVNVNEIQRVIVKQNLTISFLHNLLDKKINK